MWKYDHIDETRQRLLSKGVLDLGGEVDEAMAMYVRDALMILVANGSPNIRVGITSDGGDVKVGLAIYDFLNCYPGRITGIVGGFCRSFAMVVLQACELRLSLPHARMKIHDVLVDIEKIKSEVILDRSLFDKFYDDLVIEVKQNQLDINQIYSLRSKRSIDFIRQLSEEDREISAQEALEFGLIDRIVSKP